MTTLSFMASNDSQYQAKSVTRNVTTTMLELFKQAMQEGDKDVVSLFLDNIKQGSKPNLISEMMQNIMCPFK